MDKFDIEKEVAQIEDVLVKMDADIAARMADREKLKGRREFMLALKQAGFEITKPNKATKEKE